MALVGNKVFADDQVKMRSLGWVLTPWDWGPTGRGQDADTHRGAARGGHGEETAVCTPRREASGGPALPTPGYGTPASDWEK